MTTVRLLCLPSTQTEEQVTPATRTATTTSPTRSTRRQVRTSDSSSLCATPTACTRNNLTWEIIEVVPPPLPMAEEEGMVEEDMVEEEDMEGEEGEGEVEVAGIKEEGRMVVEEEEGIEVGMEGGATRGLRE